MGEDAGEEGLKWSTKPTNALIHFWCFGLLTSASVLDGHLP